MSALDDAYDALIATKGADYFTQWVNFFSIVKTQMQDLQASLLASVSATSAASTTIGSGAHAIDVGPDKGFKVGMEIVVAHDADNLMYGTVVSYTDNVTGPLTFTVGSDPTDIKGSGTYAGANAWTVSLGGREGPQGDPGADYTANAILNAIASLNLAGKNGYVLTVQAGSIVAAKPKSGVAAAAYLKY